MKRGYITFFFCDAILLIIMGAFIYINNKINFYKVDAEVNSTINSKMNNTENIINYNYVEYDYDYELPLNGSSGYASNSLNIYKEANDNSEIIVKINPGYGFTILEEENNYLKIEINNSIGYVKYDNVLINLPDVIPSIVYNITNSYSSMFKSSNKNIYDVTGKALYNSKFYNEKLKKEEFVVPVLYKMSKKIAKAQKEALKNGDTIVIYEGFRPYETQMKVANNLKKLSQNDNEVLKGVSSNPWSINWFIATGISNHQRGYAIDASLAKVKTKKTEVSGIYKYDIITEYEEYEMPTLIHELSINAVRFTIPVSSKSKTAWKNVKHKDTMTEGAYKLEKYCTNADLTPLASEWWHYNDNDCINAQNGDGRFTIKSIYSKIPE